MGQNLELPVKIESLSEGGYLALCSDISGCHAEGVTIGQALDNLRDVAQLFMIFVRRKDSLLSRSIPTLN